MDSVFPSTKNIAYTRHSSIEKPGLYIYDPHTFGSFVEMTTSPKDKKQTQNMPASKTPRKRNRRSIKTVTPEKNPEQTRKKNRPVSPDRTSLGFSETKQPEEVDLHCYEDVDEIFEDIDMEKRLETLSVISPKHKWVTGSDFFNYAGYNVGVKDTYPSFQYWGTDKSPFTHSISQLY